MFSNQGTLIQSISGYFNLPRLFQAVRINYQVSSKKNQQVWIIKYPQWPSINNQVSNIKYQISIINYQILIINNQVTSTNYPLSSIKY